MNKVKLIFECNKANKGKCTFDAATPETHPELEAHCETTLGGKMEIDVEGKEGDFFESGVTYRVTFERIRDGEVASK